MACENYVDCNKGGWTPEDVFRKLIRIDSNGCPALAIRTSAISPEANCTPYIDCDKQDLTWEDIFKLIVGVDENGCPIIRTVENT